MKTAIHGRNRRGVLLLLVLGVLALLGLVAVAYLVVTGHACGRRRVSSGPINKWTRRGRRCTRHSCSSPAAAMTRPRSSAPQPAGNDVRQ